ncbi:hypothetical protein AC062_0269 [Pasteurellaceae bacterium NI1060]|nr:hypothetical protein AC062_0269 [Pasteurellaceae bacterium NI1060]
MKRSGIVKFNSAELILSEFTFSHKSAVVFYDDFDKMEKIFT